jgi:hypothetical protein
VNSSLDAYTKRNLSLQGFYPKILLLIPSCTIILILLNEQNKLSSKTNSATSTSSSNHPATSPTVPAPPKSSLLNNALTASIAATLTQNNDPAVNPKAAAKHDMEGGAGAGRGDERTHQAHGSAVDVNGREVQAVTGAPPESGVDYYMNLQGIQNFMGLL